MVRGLNYLTSLAFTCFSLISSQTFLGRLLLSFGASSSSPAPEPPPTAEAEAGEEPHGTDLESGAPHPEPDDDGRREGKRVGKLVLPVALAAAAWSLVLFVNAPDGSGRPELGAAYIAFVCLGLFTSLGLSIHAVVRSGVPGTAALHKRVLLLAISFVLCAAVVRLSLVIPGAAPLH